MIDLEKVIKSLDEHLHCSGRGKSGYCPYSDDELWNDISDALALLKEPDPHLMTVEELEALPEGSVVWEEFRGDEGTLYLDPAMKTRHGELIAESGNENIRDEMGNPGPDGDVFRWWSAKPTDEQRKAAKWIDDPL